MDEGYTEIEAASIAGKPITPSGKMILNHPIFIHLQNALSNKKKKTIDIAFSL